MKTSLLTITALAMLASALGQEAGGEHPLGRADFSEMGPEMMEAVPNLVQIAVATHFFLVLESHLDLGEEQKQQLEEIDFEDRMLLIEKGAEYRLAASELALLLSRPQIQMEAIERAVGKKEQIRSQLESGRISHALKAIEVLSHQQHRSVLRIISDFLEPSPARAPLQDQTG